ncbi:MAG: hypothetical protein ACYC3F_11390 [Gemmatimonadaceae bacterium]
MATGGTAVEAARLAASTAATTMTAAHDHADASRTDGPAVPQTCATGQALPAAGQPNPHPALACDAPVARLATLVATHDPPPPLRPPRLS